MRALVTGATGFIGTKLVASLDNPVVLTRRPEVARRNLGNVQAFAWEPQGGPPPPEALANVDVIFNLAGESVAGGRWTARRKKQILDSRVAVTRNLVAGIKQLKDRPRVLVSASAVGFYGSRGDDVLRESENPGRDFLAQVCQTWEAEANRAREFGVRVVTARIGLVLGRGGGALAPMLIPFKLGLGGRLGDGKHWMPWIHLDDLVAMFLHAAKYEIAGPMNAVGPAPVTNREFTRTLAAALHRLAIFPVPAFALRVLLGELGTLLLASQRVEATVAKGTNFQFRFASLSSALEDILRD